MSRPVSSTTQEIHRFLTNRISIMLDELGVKSGLNIWYNTRNVERVATMIEEYLGLDKLALADVNEEIEA